MEHSLSSRSPSGQWYPQQLQQQQQQQQQPPQQQQQQPSSSYPIPPPPALPQSYWGSVSGATTPIHAGGPGHPGTAPVLGGVAASSATSGNSAMMGVSNANAWGGGPPHGMQMGMASPQQQHQHMMMMMMQAGMYPPQDQCCPALCGPSQGPSMCCTCCGGPQQQSMCCPLPGEPLDPFCCTPTSPGQEPGCCESVYRCFDWTYFIACLCFLLSVVGFAVVVATSSQDNIFKHFDVTTAAELDLAMQPYLRWQTSSSTQSAISASDDQSNSVPSAFAKDEFADPVEKLSFASEFLAATASQNCTPQRLLGSFGAICMENNMNANTFAVQLSSWTNARDTLWFLAMLYSGITVLYAALISVHRHPGANAMGGLGTMAAAPGMPTITPQQQEEFMKMTPSQQQAFMYEFQQQVSMAHQQLQQLQPYGAIAPPGVPPGAGCCGSDSGIQLYDTPLYEFVRVAWFISGITALTWTCNLFVSFWSFSDFYVSESTGPLQDFWRTYRIKMNASVIVVTVFLAWPLFSIILDGVVWIVFFLPWLVIRNTCKQGVQLYRPSLRASQLPGYIRLDMFFMDFEDVKRLGFSRQAWMMLTGAERPFVEGCEDPTVDKDPAMTQLMQQRAMWQQTMMSMMPPWMQQQHQLSTMNLAGSAGAGGMMPAQLTSQQLQQQQQQFSTAANSPMNAPPPSQPEYPVEEGGESRVRQQRQRRRRNSHDHRHADPLGATPMDQTSLGLGAAGRDNSTRHRHRRHSRSRSRSRGAFDGGAAGAVAAVPEATGAALPNATGVATPEGASRRRHRSSRSREVAGPGRSPPAPTPTAPPAGGDGGNSGGSGGHRRRSRSRSKAGGGGGDPSVSAAAGGHGATDTSLHHHRHHSRSMERKPPGGASPSKPVADLDALMQL